MAPPGGDGWAGLQDGPDLVILPPTPPPHFHRHIFLGFSKCGRYVLSYTSSSGDDDFSFYIYHLYWWEFNVHSKLKLVGPGLALDCPFQQHDSRRSRHPAEPQVPCRLNRDHVLVGVIVKILS